MDDNIAPVSIPTASADMLKPTEPVNLNDKQKRNARLRSKSESINQSTKEKQQKSELPSKPQPHKNDRKPKNLKGSGKPKKDGGGGKGTWGKNGEIYEEYEEKDPNDPNYKDESCEDIVMTEIVPDLTSCEFDDIVTPYIKEYYNHGISMEVVTQLAELNITHIKHRVVYLTIMLSMDGKAKEREATSVLLSTLYGEHILTAQEIEFGFQALLNVLRDISIDVPEAPKFVGMFMARCIADDILEPNFIKEHNIPQSADVKRMKALEKAESYIKMKHGLVRCDTIWGITGGARPVKKLVKMIILLIKEYLSSLDLDEVARCIRDLDVPHFHHEIVYEAVQMALDDNSQIIKIIAMINFLAQTGILTVDQLTMGFKRIYKNIDDIKLDSPRANKYLDELVDQCCRQGIISPTLRHQAPTQARKRYMSEGDFGLSNHPIECPIADLI